MRNSDAEDALTIINTALNKSMVLMDRADDCQNKIKGTKVIKIDTKAQPSHSPVAIPDMTRKSILKKPIARMISDDNNWPTSRNNPDTSMETTQLFSNCTPRPHNLEDFVKDDAVVVSQTCSTFNLDDLSDNEEFWVMDIPKTVDPMKLRGQTVSFGRKAKLKVRDERYCAISRENGNCLTWVFGTGMYRKSYKAVNMNATGTITVRRELSVLPKRAVHSSNCNPVSFPSKLKVRHPLCGSNCGEKMTVQTSFTT